MKKAAAAAKISYADGSKIYQRNIHESIQEKENKRQKNNCNSGCLIIILLPIKIVKKKHDLFCT